MLVRRNGTYSRLDEGGRVLGAFTDSRYEQRQIQLHRGDRLLLFTDGLTEATDAIGEEFGEERLSAFLIKRRKLSAAELRAGLLQAVSAFCGDDFEDDAALLVLATK